MSEPHRPTRALMSVYAGVATERERELVRQYIEGLITAIAAERARAEAAEARVAELEDHLAARQRRAELDAAGIGAVCETCGYELDAEGWCAMCTPEEVQS